MNVLRKRLKTSNCNEKTTERVSKATVESEKLLESSERKKLLSGAYVGSYWLTRVVFVRSLGAIYCKFFSGLIIDVTNTI